MPAKPTDLERIDHMLRSVDKIFRYTDQMNYEQFFRSDLVQDAVIKNFEVIGEAAYQLSRSLKDKYNYVEWFKIQGLRHILVHDYYRVNPEILWNTREKDLESLTEQLEDILKKEQR